MLFAAFWVVYRVQLHPLIIKQKIGDGMVKVTVYQGSFRGPSTKPILSLDAESKVAKEIVRRIKECRQKSVMAKIGTEYVIEIFYLDGNCDLIDVGSDVFSLSSYLESPPTTYYWRGSSLFSLIEDEKRVIETITEEK